MKNFRTKLMIILGVFSLLMTLTVSFVDQSRLKDRTTTDGATKRALVQDQIITSVTDIDKAYQMFDKDVEKRMKDYSVKLVEKYKQEPNFDKWDYQALKKQFEGMDVYVLNSGNKITHSSFAKDVGLDFNAGGPNDWTKLLDSRRNAADFVADGMDLEDATGKVKKYSYMPTPDHKYILELGLALEDGEIFKSFSFSKTLGDITSKYKEVNDVTVYLHGNALFKRDKEGKTLQVGKEKQPIFDKAEKTMQVQEYTDALAGKAVLHRLIPYVNKSEGQTIEKFTDVRVVEIIYNDEELTKLLAENKQVFIAQLFGTAVIALLISFVIARLVARPMYLAFNDLLTGLMNRAGFNTQLDEKMKRVKSKKESLALMVLDLDNFKKVNDNLGHDAGDILLKDVGRRVKAALRNFDDVAARLGGDEYTVILPGVKDPAKAEAVAARILEELKRPIVIGGVDVTADFKVTASIGIALAPEHGIDSQTLFKNADIAMYHAKKSGKNAFKTYVPGMEPEKD